MKKGPSAEKCSWVGQRPSSFNKPRWSKKAEAELTKKAVNAYVAGFEDAFAQVACAHTEMDASPFVASNNVVDGQIVPRAPPS